VRLVLVSGGGGAGVATIAAATAVRASVGGIRTYLAGVDRSDLDRTLGPLDNLPPRLSVSGPDLGAVTSVNAADALAWVRSLARWLGLDEAIVNALPTTPGIRGFITLLLAVHHDAELSVVDLGPIAEALPVIHLLCIEPSTGEHAQLRSIGGRIAGSLLARLADVPRPDGAVEELGHEAATTLGRLRSIIRDPKRVSVRIVLPADSRAERIALECRTVCGLWGMGLDALIARAGACCDFAGDGRGRIMPWRPDAPRSIRELLDLGEGVYGGAAPSDVLAESPALRFEVIGAAIDLVVPLPERPAGQFRASRQGAVLRLRAGSWQRSIHLPPAVQPLRGSRAWHDGRVFRVRFEP
jgi:hypothetical protein